MVIELGWVGVLYCASKPGGSLHSSHPRVRGSDHVADEFIRTKQAPKSRPSSLSIITAPLLIFDVTHPDFITYHTRLETVVAAYAICLQ